MLIAILACSTLLIFPVQSSYSSNFFPTSDSWVEAEYPNDNHGYETSLRVKSDSRTRRSYLKFDLSSIPSGKSLTSVKLYLYCTTGDANPTVEVYVHETGDGWTESGITWNNAPAVGSLITSVSVGGTGHYYCWDITPYGQAQYTGDRILSVVVKLLYDNPAQDNPNLARYFGSREYSGTGQDPYLGITYEDTPPTALFTYSPTYPIANDSVTFNASTSYDPDGSIASYSWDFGDGNVTTVTTAIIEHTYLMYDNYTVALTITDGSGLTDTCTQIVEVVDPAILRVSLPEGTFVHQHTGDVWIDDGWLLNKTGNSWGFTLKIYDTSWSLKSEDTHLIVALNNASYNSLQSLMINGTSIPKTAFKYGKPKPYGTSYWPGCVYPTWFNDTYINVGTILPKSYAVLSVSVTFYDSANARMHFDAYGHICDPISWSKVTWSPNSEDSTVVSQSVPSPLTVSISPTSTVLDLGQYVTFTSSVSGGTSPYSYQWYLNGTAVTGATASSWVFTPASVGYYQVHLNVTDSASKVAKSNTAGVTVNPALSVSILPSISTITLGQSVVFSSTVTGGTPPYAYKWYLNDTEVTGANSSSWNFTPGSTGYYLVELKASDAALAAKLSNEAQVTVNPRTYTLTITATSGGTTSPVPGSYVYDEGTSVQVTAFPNVNYKFVHWELDGSYNGTANPTSVVMNSNHTLKAVFAMITYTLTISATSGGTTNPAPGTYVYDSGSSVDVTAAPSANYFFDHWVLDGSNAGSASPITVLMNSNHTLQAVFSLINYTLTITATSGGTTTPAPGAYVHASGSSVGVTALPNTNYKFVRWELDGSNVTGNPITVTMDGNHSLKAVFALLTYRLTIVSSTGGTTNPVPGVYTCTNGTNADVTATPDAYYVLDYWLLDGNNVGSANPITVLMTDDHSLQPVFAHVNFTLAISATLGGTTNPAPATYTYYGGATIAVAASPSLGYRFDHWVFDSVSVGSTNPLGVLMNGSHTLQAVFVETHTLTISSSVGGTTNPAPGTYTYDNPTDVDVQAIPNANYYFDHWVYDGANIGSTNPITIHVGSGHTLYPVFSLINCTLTITSSTGGTTNPSAGTYTYANGSMASVTALPSPGYQFSSWILNGSPAGSANPISILMAGNYTLQPVFAQITYQLKIETTTGGTTNPVPSTYTYATGSLVQVTAIPNANYTLDHWELNGGNVGSANPYTVTMNQNHTLKAVLKSSPPQPPLSVSISPTSGSTYVNQALAFSSYPSGGTGSYTYQWYLNGNPVPGAVSQTWAFVSGTPGTYSVFVKATDTNGTTAQSAASPVLVREPAVGGYSVSLADETKGAQVYAYVALMALFAAVLIARKRKTE